MDFDLEVEDVFVFVEELPVHAHEIVEEVVLQSLHIYVIAEFRVDLPHNLVAEAVEETEWREAYFLERVWMDLLALIMESMKFSLSTLIFSSSLRVRKRSEEMHSLVTYSIRMVLYVISS